MYPDRELIQLAATKAALRRDIAVHRAQCAKAAAKAVQPLEWVDRMMAFWRRLPPLARFAAVPLGLLVRRTVFPRLKILRALVRWSPLVFGAVRLISRAVRIPAEPRRSPNGQFTRPLRQRANS
jgi:hypothetical protein